MMTGASAYAQHDDAQSRPQRDLPGRRQGDPRGNSRNDLQGSPQDDLRNDLQGNPQDSSQNDPRGNSQDDPQNDLRGNSQSDSQNDRQGSPQDDSQNDSQGNPQDDPRNDPQGNPQNGSRNDLQGNPQDDPRNGPQGNPQDNLRHASRNDSQRERFVYVSVDDPLAVPLFEELEYEYRTRYEAWVPKEDLGKELKRYPAQAFALPRGAFLLLLRDGAAIAGGAFMRHADPGTAEFKRIWTRASHRRQGLARRVLVELEAQAARQGYTRVFLGTGPRQPEAVALYKSTGYTLLSARDFGESEPPGVLFEKRLVP